MSKSAMESEIDFHMNKKLELFDSVGKQIESLMVFWERIMWIKKRLDSLNRWDEKGKQHKFRCEDAVDAQCCLLGLSIIPRRLNIGLSMLPGQDEYCRKYGGKDGEDVTNFTEDEGDDNKRKDGSPDTTEDEPERGRSKRSTSPGKVLRVASEESAARRRKHAAFEDGGYNQFMTGLYSSAEESTVLKKGKRSGRKSAKGSTAGKESESAVADGRRWNTGQILASASSEESAVSKKGKHRGRKSANSKAGYTRREEIEKIIKKELDGPLEDKYWEGKLPKEKRGGRKSVKDSTACKESNATAAEDSASGLDTNRLSTTA
ncbi:hypothetical protein F5883DRAFT_702780 [Diaporthe sp. PMI_573]|nr:hypothetical protein F5883DRAFT_702780 [Diaporthaceae sp. PMI_573]